MILVPESLIGIITLFIGFQRFGGFAGPDLIQAGQFVGIEIEARNVHVVFEEFEIISQEED